MPDIDGKFREDGFSGLKALKIEALSSSDGFDIESIRLYPNPASERLFLDGIPENSQIIIYGLNGNEVIRHTDATGKRVFNLTGLNSGIYQLVIVNKGQIQSRSFVVP
jgi:hypothetical protein